MSSLISSFELLVKPIAPSPPFASAPSRTVIQAYFLLLSNISTSGKEVSINLKFTSGGAPLASNKLITIFDVGVGNNFGLLDANGMTEDLVIPPGFSGLFILQPDLRNPDVLPPAPAKPSLEVRGFVEAMISSTSSVATIELLVSPQQRGTFLSDETPPDFDQIAYELPTATGKAMLTL
jgi:hypothetical protein